MRDGRKNFCSLAGALRAAAMVVGSCGFVLAGAGFLGGLQHGSIGVVHASKDSEAAGAVLFHEKGCEHCHGADARGTDRAPDLSTVGKRLKKEQIAHQIHDGGASMPAFGDVLQPDEITDLVEFLHAKRKAPRGGSVKGGTP